MCSSLSFPCKDYQIIDYEQKQHLGSLLAMNCCFMHVQKLPLSNKIKGRYGHQNFDKNIAPLHDYRNESLKTEGETGILIMTSLLQKKLQFENKINQLLKALIQSISSRKSPGPVLAPGTPPSAFTDRDIPTIREGFISKFALITFPRHVGKYRSRGICHKEIIKKKKNR